VIKKEGAKVDEGVSVAACGVKMFVVYGRKEKVRSNISPVLPFDRALASSLPVGVITLKRKVNIAKAREFE
jgi:hypothetical protein